jgi:oligopeptide transport system substrate-binding protein
VTKGGEEPAGSLVPPNSTPAGEAAYACSASVGLNVDEARKLLAEAGYPNGQGLPPIEILINTLESHKQIAEAIQNMWKTNLNVDVTIANQDWKVYLASMSKLDYQVARSSWIGDYHDPFTFLDCFVTDRGNNRTGYTSPEYDALLEQSRSMKDPAERLKVLAKAESILINDAPIMPIYFYTRIYLQAPELKGLSSNPLGIVDFKTLYFQR